MVLSLSVGSGTQLLVMILIALIFACLGFLSPPNRGALMTAVLVGVAIFYIFIFFYSCIKKNLFG